MSHTPDTRHRPAAAEHAAAPRTSGFRLLEQLMDDGPSLEEASLRGDLADAGAQIAALRAELAAAEAEQARRERAANVTVTGLRTELAAATGARDALRQALEQVVENVMHGAPDPIGAALTVLEQFGAAAAAPRRHLAVAA